MELDTDVIRVAFKFEDLTALPRFVLSDKDKTGAFNSFDQIRVDLVPVTVALVHRIAFAVERSNL